MSRVHRFFWGMGAGYVSSASNLAYTAISVPLALHFLPKDEFALWAVVLQICGYLMFLDLGVSSSVARFLADHKDSINAGDYGSILKTGRIVFCVQALVVILLALISSWVLPSFLAIPQPLRSEFRSLLFICSSIQAVGLALRAETSPLWAHQRIDITQWVISINLLTSLVCMAAGFYVGLGIYSFAVGLFGGSAVAWTLGWAACRHLQLYPRADSRGCFQKPLLIRLMAFGRDVFIMQLGTLLCSSSQIFLVTKLLGLEAAAVFSIATKTLTMLQQIIGRILESAAPGLTEMFVRKEQDNFTRRFYQMTTISVVAATIGAVGLLSANRDFVFIWTHGAIEWSLVGDIVLAITLITAVATRCFQGVFGMSADFSKVRWLPLMEGAIFIGFTLLSCRLITIEGLLAISLGSQILVSLFLSAWMVHKCFPMPSFWKSCPWWVLGTFIIVSLLSLAIPSGAKNHFLRLAEAAALAMASAIILFAGLKRQILRHPPK